MQCVCVAAGVYSIISPIAEDQKAPAQGGLCLYAAYYCNMNDWLTRTNAALFSCLPKEVTSAHTVTAELFGSNAGAFGRIKRHRVESHRALNNQAAHYPDKLARNISPLRSFVQVPLREFAETTR